jgi:H+-translocating NAD(P) transhydrogenase subunit beta
MSNTILALSYLLGSISFIIGLKMLSHPDSARKGNIYAAIGMAIAILATIFLYTDSSGQALGNYLWIFGGLIIGSVVGTIAAQKVQMTAMPQMVSLFNGMGGACAAIISIVEFRHLMHQGVTLSDQPLHAIIILAGLVIGTVSFTGSMIAFGKLNGNINDRTLPFQQVFNIGLLLVIVVLLYCMITGTGGMDANTLFYILLLISVLYGVLFVMPIGGADMPVVISLLNSFTGVAAAFGGFLYNNPVMLTGGILVGSAGTVLTVLMCNAMNRSLTNVLIGSFGSNNAAGVQSSSGGNYKEISMTDAAVLMNYSKKIIIVPGYGLAAMN